VVGDIKLVLTNDVRSKIIFKRENPVDNVKSRSMV
jgi:hypothetical protein